MTLGHEPLGARLGAGVGISLLLHALVFSLAFLGLRPSKPPAPPHYRIRLVDLPAPAPKGPAPSEMAKPAAPRAARPAVAAPAPKPETAGEGPTVPEAATSPDRTGEPAPVLGPVALYDREAIESTAKSSARAEAEKDDGVTFETEDMMYRSYLDMLRQKVESIWEYPRRAAEEGIYGDVIIRFIILRDGTLGEVRVLRTSGHSILDKAAVKALRDGVPYWALPEGWNRQSLPITGRFIYSINGGYIR